MSAGERLRARLAESGRWGAVVKALPLVAVAMADPVDLDGCSEDEELAICLWAAGADVQMPERLSDYLAKVAARCWRFPGRTMTTDDKPVMRFRFHRGSLADSMATLREFRSDLEFRHAIEDWLEPCDHGGPPDLSVMRRTRIEPYGEGPDDRIGWPKTFIVKVDDMVVGFADSDGSNLPMWT